MLQYPKKVLSNQILHGYNLWAEGIQTVYTLFKSIDMLEAALKSKLAQKTQFEKIKIMHGILFQIPYVSRNGPYMERH